MKRRWEHADLQQNGGGHAGRSSPPAHLDAQPNGECPKSKGRRFMSDSLQIKHCYLDEKHDRCYCAECAARARNPDVLDRGTDHPYEVPKGWCGFALKLPPKAEDLDIFKWPVAFHSCPSAVLPSGLRGAAREELAA